MFNALKTTLLLAILTGLLMAAGYYFGGQNGALIALLVSLMINFGSYWFSDRIVLKMYRAREATTSDQPQVHRLVEELAVGAGMPKPRLFVLDLPTPNAFATGRNQERAVIAVSQSLLELLNEKELRGVLAHELAHIKNKDILLASLAATLAGAISYLAQMAYWAGIFGGQSRGGSGRDGSNVFTLLALVIVTPIIATILHLAISRSREYLADATAARLTSDPNSLASALKKLHAYAQQRPLLGQPKHESTAHLFIVNPFKPSFLMNLFSTHPPMEERVKKLESWQI